jgi:hypothetical protein
VSSGVNRRVLDVVEADDRKVLRHAQPARSRGLNGSDRDVVVESGRWPSVDREG